MNSVYDYLAKNGPSLSSEVVCFLIKESGITPEAARKRISRLPSTVCKLRRIGLPKNEVFLYLKDQWKSELYIEKLKDALKKTGSALGLALFALEARHGYVKHEHFPIASGLPVKYVKKQLSHSMVEEHLFELGLTKLEQTKNGTFVSLSDEIESLNRHQAIALAEDIVLQALKPWMANLGIVSSGKTEIRTKNCIPNFGPFNWDLVGPSYLAGLVPRSGPSLKNAFVVADILLDRKVTPEDLTPFLHKCDTISNQKTHCRFLPAFVADWFERPALDMLRKRGCLIGTVSNFFGNDVAEQIRALIRVVCNAAAAIVKNPEEVFNLLGKLSKFEGASNNLRGVVFELIIARLYAIDGYQIDIRQKIQTFNGEKAEIDIKAIKTSNEVVCIECKAKAPGNSVDADEVKDWVDNRLPRIKEWLRNCPSLPPQKRFEFCVSGEFTERALTYVQDISAKHRKQPLSFLTGDDIRNRLRDSHQSSLVQIYNEHFANKL